MSWTAPAGSDQALLIALAGLSLLLPSAAFRRRAVAGTLLVALALASLRVAVGSGGELPGPSPSYFAITAGLGALGFGLTLLAALRASAGEWAGWSRPLAAGATLVALALGVLLFLPLARHGGWGRSLVAAVGLGGLGMAAGAALPLLRLGDLVRRADRLLGARVSAGRVPGAWDRGARALLVLQAGLGVLALSVPYLPLLLLVIGAGAAAGVILERRLDRGRTWAPSVILALLLLGGVGYMLIHVAGDMPLTVAALVEAPYSGAFELLVSLPAALAGWALLGLWPFHLSPRGPLTGLFGAVLLARVVGPLLPAGLAHWQPVLYPLAVLAAWHAVAARNGGEAIAAFAALGVAAGSAAAGWCGTAAVLLGMVACRRDVLHAVGWPDGPRGEAARRLVLLAGAPLVLPVLVGALQVQTVYTVAALLGLVAAARSREPAARVDPAG